MLEFIELFLTYLFGIFIINVIIYFVFKHITKLQNCNKKILLENYNIRINRITIHRLHNFF